MPMHIRKPEIPPLKTIGEFLVVDPEEMQQRRMEIVDMHDVLYGVIPQVIGVTVTDAALNAATCHPH